VRNKAVFLDKDGTLIEDVPYNVDPEKIRLNRSCIEGLQKLQEDNFKLIVISNQSGIARGYFSVKELEIARSKLMLLLNEAGVRIDGFYYCPHHPAGIVHPFAISCECRKPMPGMILQAAREHNVNLIESWMIGDILHDVEAGTRAGCKTILIDNGNETEWNFNDLRRPNFYAETINEAAEFILTTANYEFTGV
jgi:D-glycero-D-manno-heptose 1,7-bisphosphate phosphatase